MYSEMVNITTAGQVFTHTILVLYISHNKIVYASLYRLKFLFKKKDG